MDAKMQAIIKIAADGVWITPGMYFPEFMQLMASTELQMMRGLYESIQADKDATDEQKEQFKHDLYDAYNQAASSVLALFAPELELRPDLTAEAILRAENEILDEKIAAGDIQGASDAAGYDPSFKPEDSNLDIKIIREDGVEAPKLVPALGKKKK